MLSVVFDMDGVLADFIFGFLWTANRFVDPAVPVYRTPAHETWSFDHIMSRRNQTTTWRIIKDSDDWWNSLNALVNEQTFRRINSLSLAANVYFCTARPSRGRPAGLQTALWLRDRGVQVPNVVVSDKKGEFCRLVEADFSIEDKWDNAHCIHWLSPDTHSFLINRPYNQVQDKPKVGSNSVRRVQTVDEFLNIVEGAL